MAGRGVFFAISDEDLNQLLRARNDAQVASYLHETIEEKWEQVYEVDKAWEGIDRCLTQSNLADGPDRDILVLCFFGGIQLHWGDEEVIALILPREAAVLAEALKGIDRDALLRHHTHVVGNESNLPGFVENFEYLWNYFEGLPAFLAGAAEANRAVLFSVD